LDKLPFRSIPAPSRQPPIVSSNPFGASSRYSVRLGSVRISHKGLHYTVGFIEQEVERDPSRFVNDLNSVNFDNGKSPFEAIAELANVTFPEWFTAMGSMATNDYFSNFSNGSLVRRRLTQAILLHSGLPNRPFTRQAPPDSGDSFSFRTTEPSEIRGILSTDIGRGRWQVVQGPRTVMDRPHLSGPLSRVRADARGSRIENIRSCSKFAVGLNFSELLIDLR
jgi:hypothetical protein